MVDLTPEGIATAAGLIGEPPKPEDESWEQFVDRVHKLFAGWSDESIKSPGMSEISNVAHYGRIGREAWETNIKNGRRLLNEYLGIHLAPRRLTSIVETPWGETVEAGVRLKGLTRGQKGVVARALLNLEARTRDLKSKADIDKEKEMEEEVKEAEKEAEGDEGEGEVKETKEKEPGASPEMISEKPYIRERDVDKHVRELVQESHIPYFAQYIAGKTTDIEILVEAISSLPRQNILLLGETGLGKTMSLEAVAFLLRYPYLSVNLNGGTTVESLIGQWIPSAGGFKWVDGVLTKMVRYGGLFVAEEVNAANPETSFVLFPLLDTKRQIILTDHEGEIIKAHSDFVFAATMNPADPEYVGAQRLNKALFDRFDIVLEYTGKNVKRILEEKAVIEFYEKIKPMISAGEIVGTASIRGLRQYLYNSTRHGKAVARTVLLQKFDAGTNRDSVEEILNTLDL